MSALTTAKTACTQFGGRCLETVAKAKFSACGGSIGQSRLETAKTAVTAKTDAERQELRRKRLLILEGRTEVRGIYLPPALHASLKEHAAKLLRAYKPKEKE